MPEVRKSKLAATALIFDEKFRVLGVSRKDDPSMFGLPGGKVDEGETLEEAIVREVKEETGLELLEFSPFYFREDTDYVAVVFLVTEYRGEIQTEESGVVKWVTFEDLKMGAFSEYNSNLEQYITFMKKVFSSSQNLASRKIGVETKKLYGNCRVYHPDGSLMFLCREKKINWYLKRDLAVIVGNDPISIQLTFEPNGKGAGVTEAEKAYYLAPKKNICVVCGTDNLEELTKHHVVPREYRAHFEEIRKNRSSHDIVVICKDDHARYENTFATPLKKQLAKKYGVRNTSRSEVSKYYKIYNIALMMLDYERISKVPQYKIEKFKADMKQYFGTEDPYEVSQMDFHLKLKKEEDEASRILVEKLENVEKFIVMWRKHFVETMNPNYMPEMWSIYHGITFKQNEPTSWHELL